MGGDPSGTVAGGRGSEHAAHQVRHPDAEAQRPRRHPAGLRPVEDLRCVFRGDDRISEGQRELWED